MVWQGINSILNDTGNIVITSGVFIIKCHYYSFKFKTLSTSFITNYFRNLGCMTFKLKKSIYLFMNQSYRSTKIVGDYFSYILLCLLLSKCLNPIFRVSYWVCKIFLFCLLNSSYQIQIAESFGCLLL